MSNHSLLDKLRAAVLNSMLIEDVEPVIEAMIEVCAAVNEWRHADVNDANYGLTMMKTLDELHAAIGGERE